ncbi:MAG TPA: Zn-ribbon domain-containing OB-fold protein [Acidimicrobiia bacterium]|nr:Zn-ribbon domain-containing OB-fold protein [Acidimicrobiia bacterium]
MDRPLPLIDDTNRHYWEAAREHRLVMLRCAACGTWVHPPRGACRVCRSDRLEPEELSGRGHVYSWSVMNSPGNPGFEDRIPYAVLVVELEEQQGLFTIGNVVDCPLDEIEIGMPLEVTWEDVTDEITLPQWQPARRTEPSAGASR